MVNSDAPDTSRIDQAWPEDGLERVDCCPYCDSAQRVLFQDGVQDWSFYCAPGQWAFWRCTECRSLYLDPRPSAQTLGRAYASYYTHGHEHAGTVLQSLKMRLKNECWSHWFDANIQPRLGIPRGLGWLLTPLRSRTGVPFELLELTRLRPGSILDVGCGNGEMLGVAERLGWHAVGLELDPRAAHAARVKGLEVVEGSYSRLVEFEQSFDVVICSHVLEHVHDPRDLLAKLAGALRPGGTLLLSCPNASSRVGEYFGRDWRGLEAPRHLSIPSMQQLEGMLRDVGFRVRKRLGPPICTAAESSRIRRRGARLSTADVAAANALSSRLIIEHEWEYDFVEFSCAIYDARQ